MENRVVKMKFIDKVIKILPWIIAILFLVINNIFNLVNIFLPGLQEIINSLITFTSIIIGILTALFGIIISLTDKEVMIKLQKNNDDKTIYKYSIETLLSNFLLLIFSIVLQSLTRFDPALSYINHVLTIWLGIIGFVLTSSLRTIYFLLLISFNHNDKSSRPVSEYKLRNDERRKLREKYSEE